MGVLGNREIRAFKYKQRTLALNMKEKITLWRSKKSKQKRCKGKTERESGERARESGGVKQKMSKTKREEIALKAVGLSELNHRVPAVQSDSALALNITVVMA